MTCVHKNEGGGAGWILICDAAVCRVEGEVLVCCERGVILAIRNLGLTVV